MLNLLVVSDNYTAKYFFDRTYYRTKKRVHLTKHQNGRGNKRTEKTNGKPSDRLQEVTGSTQFQGQAIRPTRDKLAKGTERTLSRE